MRLKKALTYPRLTPEFAERLEKRRASYLKKYRLINDLLERSTGIEAKPVQNILTKILYKLFGWLVVKDETI